jgi:hypothetical protein
MTASDQHPLPAPLQRAHEWARSRPWLARFTLANRLLLAMAFLPTGLVKATGQRFTSLGVDNPVGFFFEAMYQTGPYWQFIGSVQVAAAILLLIPATAAFGALLFLPVGLSVFLITWGIGFGTTTWITAGMVLSVVYLICWDGDRVWAALAGLWGRGRGPGLLEAMHPVETAGWALGGAAGMGLFLITRSFLPGAHVRWVLSTGIAGGALVLVGWARGGLRARRLRSP